MNIEQQHQMTQTPVGNTGVNSAQGSEGEIRLECLIDWLQGTYPSANRDRVMGLCSSYFGGAFEEQPHGIRYFARCFKNPLGALIAIEQRLPGSTSNDVKNVQALDYLELRADVVNVLPQERLRVFMIELSRLQFRATRLDATMDIFNPPFSVWDVKEAFDSGNITGFRSAGQLHTKGRNASKGLTFALGNRGASGSGKYLVFYDKGLESNGERNCLRCENSLYSHFAVQAFERLCDFDHTHWSELIKSLIVWSVDFVDRVSSTGNLRQACRSPRLPWWQKVIQETGSACLAAPKRHNSFEKMKAWVNHQVAPTLALIKKVFDTLSPKEFHQWLTKVLAQGQKRFKSKHDAAFDAFQAFILDERQYRLMFCLNFQTALRLGIESFNYSWDAILSTFYKAEEFSIGLESDLPHDYWHDVVCLLGVIADDPALIY